MPVMPPPTISTSGRADSGRECRVGGLREPERVGYAAMLAARSIHTLLLADRPRELEFGQDRRELARSETGRAR